MTIAEIKSKLSALADEKRAVISRRFFKTGPGEYGEGDQFIGIRVPVLRKLAKEYKALPIKKAETLLQSSVHEQRQLALFILILIYKRADEPIRKQIYDLYLKNTAHINNWDLIDVSAEHIVGHYLWERSKTSLFNLAQSNNLWERRIAVLSTFHYIKKEKYEHTLKIAEILLNDKEDLIHKAVGWMLREVGKRHLPTEERFLKNHYQGMPRTMLRYAIEKFPEKKRQRYLKGLVAKASASSAPDQSLQ